MEKPANLNTMLNAEETRCRPCFFFRFAWTDKLGNPKVFMVINGLINITQGMLFTYFVGVMTSFEKHFQLKSEALGTVVSIGELIPAIVSIILSYIGGKGDRPRWMAFAMLMLSLGCYTITLPYFIFGVPDRGAINKGSTVSSNQTTNQSLALCTRNSTTKSPANLTNCELDSTQENSGYAVALYLMGYTIFTTATVIFYIVGTPYIDDNVQQKNSPVYLALAGSFRALGPLLGYVLSYASLSLYVNPTEVTSYSSEDSQWIGAWWLGYIVMATIGLVAAFFVAQFPVRLASRHATPAMEMAAKASCNKKDEANSHQEDNTGLAKISASMKGFLTTFRRVLTNIYFLLRTGSDVLSWIGIICMEIFLPKYFEHQFSLPKSEASMWSGVACVAPHIIGILVAGVCIQRLRPTSRQLTMAIIGSKTFYAVSLVVFLFLKCNNEFVNDDSYSSCDPSCDCSSLTFEPTCGYDGRNYLSPCHAGCLTVNITTEPWVYDNCTCISGGKAIAHRCSNRCTEFYVYVIIKFISNLLFSIDTIGPLLFLFRCCSAQDKTVAVGLFSSSFSLFCFIPGPLIFSVIVDSTCSLWAYSCGQRGACNVYDVDLLRIVLHVIPLGLLLLGIVLDVVLWFKCKKISLFGEETTTEPSQSKDCLSLD